MTCTVATRIVATRIMTHFLAGAVTARARKAEAGIVSLLDQHNRDQGEGNQNLNGQKQADNHAANSSVLSFQGRR